MIRGYPNLVIFETLMKKHVLIISFLFASMFGFAQPNPSGFSLNQNRTGFMFGLATQEIGPLGVNEQDQYRGILLKGQYNWVLTNWQKGGIEILLQPQLNFSQVQTNNQSTDIENGLEFGVNVGLLARKNLFENKSAIYALISAGPHFITKSIETQAKGFLFSDNFAIGFLQNISSKTYLDFRFGYRHMSNASLKQPNRGIDNWVVSVGINFGL